MSLSTLISERHEQYGGVEQKRKYYVDLGSGLMLSVLCHGLFVLACVITTLMEEPTGETYMQSKPPSKTIFEDFIVEKNTTSSMPKVGAMRSFGRENIGGKLVAVCATLPPSNRTEPVVPVDAPITNDEPRIGTVDPVRASTMSMPVARPAVAKAVVSDPDPDHVVFTTEDAAPVVPIEQLVQYPPDARRSGLEGRVRALVLVGMRGEVEQIRIEQADYELFATAAREAILKAHFTPARNGSEPVKVWMPINLTFRLSK